MKVVCTTTKHERIPGTTGYRWSWDYRVVPSSTTLKENETVESKYKGVYPITVVDYQSHGHISHGRHNGVYSGYDGKVQKIGYLIQAGNATTTEIFHRVDKKIELEYFLLKDELIKLIEESKSKIGVVGFSKHGDMELDILKQGVISKDKQNSLRKRMEEIESMTLEVKSSN